jgi:hypothetical protein
MEHCSVQSGEDSYAGLEEYTQQRIKKACSTIRLLTCCLFQLSFHPNQGLQ